MFFIFPRDGIAKNPRQLAVFLKGPCVPPGLEMASMYVDTERVKA